MDKAARNQLIARTRAEIGWVYPELRWFSQTEAEAANRQRDKLLEELSGRITLSFRDMKPHHGPLSRGCLICGNGGWDCHFINRLCTRNCFFCPQDRSASGESVPVSAECPIETPADHVRYIRTFNIRGVAFSGGEPLLVREKLLEDIRAIKTEFVESVYVWLYTNGDLADREALSALREAGLDEIRFNLSAREYDLEPVIRAKEFIPVVTVEIPAIPEDMRLLEGMLGKLESIGVSHLNLHQLDACAFNYRALSERGYHFLHQANVPVFESEMAALGLLQYARQNDIHLPINYCSEEYKNRFQGLDGRMRMGRAVLRGCEELTDAGYIRTFRAADRDDGIRLMLARIRAHARNPSTWEASADEREVTLHSSLLPYVDWSTTQVRMQYLEPADRLEKLGSRPDAEKPSPYVDRHRADPQPQFPGSDVVPRQPDAAWDVDALRSHSRLVYESRLGGPLSVECWRRLYLLKEDSRHVLRLLLEEMPSPGRDAVRLLRDEIANLRGLAEWEELPSGLPEIC